MPALRNSGWDLASLIFADNKSHELIARSIRRAATPIVAEHTSDSIGSRIADVKSSKAAG